MLKRGMRDNHNDITDQDYEDFAKRTDQYSASDISILVRDAVYEPVRRLQLAKKFRRLQNGKWTPCREGEEGEPKTWTDFKDQSELDIGFVSRLDFDAALKRTKPSVDQKQLAEYEEFTKSFGQDG
jgi:vacuolar protein-sorting-associated protein 4